jgi:hypothetical protein
VTAGDGIFLTDGLSQTVLEVGEDRLPNKDSVVSVELSVDAEVDWVDESFQMVEVGTHHRGSSL